MEAIVGKRIEAGYYLAQLLAGHGYSYSYLQTIDGHPIVFIARIWWKMPAVHFPFADVGAPPPVDGRV